LSPSGKLLGYANPAGSVAVWDLEHHTPAVVLRHATEPIRTVESMAFSPDESRLLIKRLSHARDNSELELWDLPHRRTVPIARNIPATPFATESAFLGPTPNTVVIGIADGGANVYDVTTGQLVRSSPR